MLVTLHHVEDTLERFEFEITRPQGPYIGDVTAKPLGHPVSASRNFSPMS